jgi:hypothetical protein
MTASYWKSALLGVYDAVDLVERHALNDADESASASRARQRAPAIEHAFITRSAVESSVFLVARTS